MPESSATNITIVPLTKPSPITAPPPGTDNAGSGVSCSQPASVDSSKNGVPGSSKRATRSRGSNCPRLANNGPACALRSRVRDSIMRSSAIKPSW
ncbi:MAG: hypothetical protein EB110_09200 [Betaproteobacteria bacterium]|nr:hypothetical protein [Betaproteobacteria bacterium]